MTCEDEGHVLKHHESLGTISHECDCGWRTSFDMAPEGLCAKCDGTCIRCNSSPARRHKVEDDQGVQQRICDHCWKKNLIFTARLNGDFDLNSFEVSIICFIVGLPMYLYLHRFVHSLSGVAKGVIVFAVMASAVYLAHAFAMARWWRRGETRTERKAREKEETELAER